MKTVCLLLIWVHCLIIIRAASPLQPEKLTCEYMKNPLGIDAHHPRLNWNFSSTQRSQYQTAYELLVSDNLSDIQQLKGNVWATGKITSSQNIQIEYAGKPLQSFTRYYWSVKVYNQQGEASSWSRPAWFETAMLQASDWRANWIGDGSKNPEMDEDYYKDDQMPLMRKSFIPSKKIIQARMYIGGLGYYEAYLNGVKIGDHVLDPGFTTYKMQVQYVVYDITAYLKKGMNTVGVMLGNGWYNPLPMRLFGRIDLRKYQQTGRPCVKAEIHLRYNDGSIQKIITDESWQTAPGPIVRNNVYLGEKYDARLERVAWSNQKPNAEKLWKNAVVVEGPSGGLAVQMQPAIKITRILRPVRITEIAKDTFIVDMGQNFAGVARIKVKGPAGTKISLRYGEDIYEDGRLNYMTSVTTQIKKGVLNGGPGAPETAWQQDDYLLKGGDREIWSPRFTFHAFRYVEIAGWPGKPTLDDIEGLRMNSDLEQTGIFSCSNNMFNKLHDAIQWTFLSNVFSIQSDCPGREKMGYGADMVVTANAFQFNYDMSNFYRKAVKDFANDQQPDGGITEMSPYMGIADKGYGGQSGPLGWQLAFAYLQEQLYEFYGDKRIIEENYLAVTKQINFLQSKAVDGLFYWDIGDHEAIDPKPEAFSAAAFYYHHVKLAEKFAGLLAKKDDSLKYAKLSHNIRNAIIQKYLVQKTGRFDNATQSAQLFALWYNFSPEKSKSFQWLINEFERHNMHVSSGIFGVKMMFDVLRENNRNDLAYSIAAQPDYPGWGYMLFKGATTLWESWEYPEKWPSQNHPMFGSVDEWFYRSLVGINAGKPGFEEIIIKPQPAGDLTWAKGSYQSIRGKIASDWKIENQQFILNVSIPANTTATIWVPCKQNAVVMESNKPMAEQTTMKLLKYENGYALVETGSGDYSFRVDY